MNFSFETSRATKYIATVGDQIELIPPSTPDTTPNPRCQPWPGPIRNLIPNKRFNENNTMAIPIATVKSAVGYSAMNVDVTKMQTMIATAKSQYSRAIAHLSDALAN